MQTISDGTGERGGSKVVSSRDGWRVFGIDFRPFFDVRSGEFRRAGYLAALLFFLLAANNVIKVVRDSLFLSRFPISQLPYVYLLAALVAGIVIALYSHFTAKLPLSRILPRTFAFIIINVILFWFLLVFYNAGWVLYAYYLWSAIIGLIVVAQFWTFANQMFTPREGKRLFGIITAGGTVGGIAGGMVSNFAVQFFLGTRELLWLVAALIAGAGAIAYYALKEQAHFPAARDHVQTAEDSDPRGSVGVLASLAESRYLQTIAAVVFVSVIVSTLIDYQFKATAKLSYASADALAGFFGAYYGWLSVVTVTAQLGLTGKLLTSLGLTQSLLVLPLTLLAASLGLLAWPGLGTATAARMTEAALRTSVYQSSVQILYLPLSNAVKKKVKVFMDVTMERLGDGVAALLILAWVVYGDSGTASLNFFVIPLLVLWAALILAAKTGYIEALRRIIAYRGSHLESVPFEFDDKTSVQTVMNVLQRSDENSLLIGLDLLGRMEPKTAARLPRTLLRHESREVRRHALIHLARLPDIELVEEVKTLLSSEDAQVQTEAINAISTILRKDAVPFIRPLLQSPEPPVRRAAMRGLLLYGTADRQTDAVNAFDSLMAEPGPDGEKNRIEAVRLIAEFDHPAFRGRLAGVIANDPSPAVVREAMKAAALRAEAGIIPLLIARLSDEKTKTAARDALVSYGEMAIGFLRDALFHTGVAREVRLNIPHTLSKIAAQSALDALLAAFEEEDRSIRFQAILAVEEMTRHFKNLNVDRELVQNAIISDALLYSKRFVAYEGLFRSTEAPRRTDSLLYYALTDSMERIKERVVWLLALIHPAEDIRRAWYGLNSADPTQRAHAVELLDNLLIGTMKKYAFTLYCDHQPDQRLHTAMDLAGVDRLDPRAALRGLLDQEDVWLRAGAIWEIGRRRIAAFAGEMARLVDSDEALINETAKLALERVEQSPWADEHSAR